MAEALGIMLLALISGTIYAIRLRRLHRRTPDGNPAVPNEVLEQIVFYAKWQELDVFEREAVKTRMTAEALEHFRSAKRVFTEWQDKLPVTNSPWDPFGSGERRIDIEAIEKLLVAREQ